LNSCTDLRRLAAGHYRVHNENAGRRAYEGDDPWDLILPGRAGFVAPWAYVPPRGSGALVACTNSTVTTKRLLTTIPGCAIDQDGADGANVAFPAEYLDAVAAILRLRRRRQYTPEQRQAAAARLAAVRPQTLSGVAVSPQILPIGPWAE
jgi:hypothetical protein